MAKLMAADGSCGGGAIALADGDQSFEAVPGPRVRPFLSDYAAASSQQPHPQMPLSTGGVTSTETISASPSPTLDREREPAYPQRGALRRARRRSAHLETPYERPATGRHAAAGPQAASVVGAAATSGQVIKAGRGGRGAWLGSGFSKIITNGATYLYSSIFRRQLAPPLRISSCNPPVQVATVEQLNEDEEPSSPSLEAQKDDQAGNGPVDAVDGPDHSEPEMADSSLSDVEKLLKQQTLSRDEFDRLTALLQSRVVSNGVEKKAQQQQPKHVQFDVRTTRQEIYPSSGGSQSEAQRWRQDLQKAREERENGIRTLALYENGRPSPGTPARAAERVDALSSSPVEVAIAYMGGRPLQPPESSPVEPLNQRDENRVSRGALPSPSPRLTHTALTKWSGPEILNDDQFRTPPPTNVNSWGRNQRIFRTPYSRPLRLQAPRESAIDGTFGTPSASRWTPIRTPLTGGREMLKRRSTVLDDGWSSGGPIRRTRHKAIVSGTPSSVGPSRGTAAFPSTPASVTPSNLSHSRGSTLPLTPVSGAWPSALTSPIGALSGTTPGRNVGASSASTSISDSASKKDVLAESGNFYVPAQASATARKILETLEKMTPSPKGNALGEELAHVRERLPAALTEGMLNDQARKSMTTVEFPLPMESREPGPSSRNVEESSPQQPTLGGFPGSSFKISDLSTKGKGKGKASVPPVENGPAALGQEGARLGDGPAAAKPPSVRPRETESALAGEAGRSKGFHINANFEESGSEDEGRFAVTSRSPPAFPIATSKAPNAAAKGSAAKPPLFMASSMMSSTITSGAGLSSFPSASAAVEIPKPASTGFTFPTRVSVEGPPTPKAMSPASTSPTSSTPAAPYFQFPQVGEQLVVPGGPAEPGGARGEIQPSSNTEFAFGASPAFPSSGTLPLPKLQMPLDAKASSVAKQSSPFFGGLSSNTSSPSSPSFTTGATSFPAAATGPKFGDAALAPPSGSALKPGAALSNTSSPFPTSASSPVLFGSGNSARASVSGMAPSPGMFGNNGAPGTAPPPSTNLFGTSSGTSVAVPPGFGQLNSFSFKGTSVTAAVPSTSTPAYTPASSGPTAPGGAKEESTSMPVTERPLKRPVPSFQPELSKRQQPAATSTHSFTAFGTSVGTSAAFGTGSSSSTTSQGLLPLSTFGQPSSSAPQTSSSLPSAAAGAAAAAAPAVPFTFGNPATAAGSTSSAASSAAFGSAPSFPSFGSSAFGTTSSGSIFGLNPPAPTPGSASGSASTSAAAPMAFGGSSTSAAASIFGSTGTSSGFGGFASESSSQSQAPPSPVFGSGFTSTSHSSSPAFAFGSGVPSFGAGAGSGNSSGSTFSPFQFPPPGGKSVTPSPQQQQQQQTPPSIFGLASSIPAFGSTTNGTMASDVVVNDQSNMDDNSMAEEPSQLGNSVSPEPSSMFNGQSGAGAGTGSAFVFGAQTGAPGALGGAAPGGASIFGGFPPPGGNLAAGGAFGAPAANPFAAAAAGAQPTGGSLDFSGGSFTLGSGGDRPARKFLKVKRTSARRGK